MKKVITILILSIAMFYFFPANIHGNDLFAQELSKKNEKDKKLFNRIDFGNSYIMGQTIKSGAVYLLRRKQNEIKSMLRYRKDYREEILENFHIQNSKP